MLDKTYVLKGKQEPEWLLVDATGQGIGRLATPVSYTHLTLPTNREV
jgi:large subunit ribosomal protein L13